ncbi:MAG: PPC domain-containing protein [Deltaproteobacteria bacterium]|nr:PPC domain-containing protein [Deltaproteobacteria bacterium]
MKMRMQLQNVLIMSGLAVMLAVSGCSKKKGNTSSGKDKAASSGGPAQRIQKTKDGVIGTATIAKKGDKRTFQVDVKKGMLIDLSLTNAPATSSSVDYTADLIDPQGKRVARMQDGNGSDGTTTINTRVYGQVAGTYKVVVYDWDNDEVDPKQPFKLTVRIMADPDSLEPNNGPNLDSNKALAKPIVLGKPISAFLEYRGDEDWYKFQAKKNTIVDVRLTNAPATSSPLDYTVELWNATTKHKVWRMGDGNGSDGTTVLATRAYVPADGTYYIRVYDWDGDDYDSHAGYKLTVVALPEPDKNEPNNGGNLDGSRALATPLQSGKTVICWIEYRGDQDWFKIPADKGKLLDITLSNAPATSSPVDYHVELWGQQDKDKRVRVGDGNGSDGTTVLHTVAYVPSKGMWYLKIFDWDDNEYEIQSPYHLTATVLDDPDKNEPNQGSNFDSSKAMAKPLPKSKSLVGYVEYRGDSDWFVLEHKGGALQVNLINAPATTTPVDLSMTLYNEAGKKIAGKNDGNGADGTTKVAINQVLPAGKYYLKIFDWDDDEFDLKQGYSVAYGAQPRPVPVAK